MALQTAIASNKEEVVEPPSTLETDDSSSSLSSSETLWHKSAWRMDPKNSYSDWKIEIEVLSSVGTDTSATLCFHVHKFFLAVGPRKSLYFDRLFKSQMKESKDEKTSLTLEPSAANAFPAFLDYIYTGQVELKPSSAVALGYLADYFGVANLQPLADAFIHKDIQASRANVHVYCQEAIMYKNSQLVETLMKTVATLSHDDLLQAASSSEQVGNSKSQPSPVAEMMSLLSLEQRNRVYLEALRVAHAEMARLKPVTDFYTGVFSNVAFRPELTPDLFECLERGGAARSTHGQTWMPLFYYDGRA